MALTQCTFRDTKEKLNTELRYFLFYLYHIIPEDLTASTKLWCLRDSHSYLLWCCLKVFQNLLQCSCLLQLQHQSRMRYTYCFSYPKCRSIHSIGSNQLGSKHQDLRRHTFLPATNTRRTISHRISALDCRSYPLPPTHRYVECSCSLSWMWLRSICKHRYACCRPLNLS